jgi:hypothetical protein
VCRLVGLFHNFISLNLYSQSCLLYAVDKHTGMFRMGC